MTNTTYEPKNEFPERNAHSIRGLNRVQRLCLPLVEVPIHHRFQTLYSLLQHEMQHVSPCLSVPNTY